MTKHIIISLSIIAIGFCFLYWSGLISETTNNNWQGVTGIVISAIGAIALVFPFFYKKK